MTASTPLDLDRPEVAALARWHARWSVCVAYPSRGAEVPSRMIPKTAALAREILSPLVAERWTRGTDNGLRTIDGAPADERDLRAALVDFVSALPEDLAAGRPYRDLRALVLDDPALGVARRDREREEYLAALTTSTRANLPRYRAPRVEVERRRPLTDAERMRRDRAAARATELEAARRALHAWAEGFPHRITDDESRAAYRAALPARERVSALVDWVQEVSDKWWNRWDEDPFAWAATAAHIGAPFGEPGSPGPRVARREVRRAFRRTYRSKGTESVRTEDYRAEEMRDLITLYDARRDALTAAEAEADAERRERLDAFAADLLAVITKDYAGTEREADAA